MRASSLSSSWLVARCLWRQPGMAMTTMGSTSERRHRCRRRAASRCRVPRSTSRPDRRSRTATTSGRRTPRPMAIKRWTSSMTPGSHHMIVFLTNTDVTAGRHGVGRGLRRARRQHRQHPGLDVLGADADRRPAAAGRRRRRQAARAWRSRRTRPGSSRCTTSTRATRTIKVHVTLNAEALDEGVDVHEDGRVRHVQRRASASRPMHEQPDTRGADLQHARRRRSSG